MAANVQVNFSGGEWSKEAQGRYDDPNYAKAMALCRNSLPSERGAWIRRPGTKHGGHTYQGLPGCLISYDFEADAPYQMEFTANALRFWSDGSLLTDGSFDIAAVSSGAPAIITTSAAHGWTTNDEVLVSGLGFQCSELHNRQLAITVLSTTAFSVVDPISRDPIAATGYTSGGTVSRIHRVESPYLGNSWENLRSIQTDDEAILLSGLTPHTLYTADEGETFTIERAFFTDGPYLDPVAGGTLATPSAKTGIINVTLSFNAYVAGKAYKKGDYVTYSTVNYQSLTDANVGNQPDISPTRWIECDSDDAINDGEGLLATDIGRLVRLFSEPPLWAVATAYSTAAVVAYNGTYWTALTGSTGKIPGVDTTNWTLTPGNAAQWGWGRITQLLTLIDYALAGSTNFGDMTGSGGIAPAFDGNTDQTASVGATASTTSGALNRYAYIGKDYSGATNQVISSGTIWPSNDQGFISGSNPGENGSIVFNLRASNTAPANRSDGTLLGTTTMATDQVSPVSVTSNDTTTAWDYVWFELIMTVATPGLYGPTISLHVAEAQFFNPPSAGGNGFKMELLGEDLLYTTPARVWRLGAFSESTGFPKCGTWHEGRLWLSGVLGNRIDASKSNDPFNFAPTGPTGAVADSNAISYRFNSPDVSPIYWMEPDTQGIICGTKRGEWVVRASNLNLPLSPTNIQAKRDSKVGCADFPPASCPQSTVVIQTEKRKVVEHFADSYSGKFVAPNLAAMANHLTKDGIVELAYQQELVPVLWMRTGTDALVGCTYKRDVMTTGAPPTLNGWHRHDLGSGRTVESLSVGPSVEGSLNSLAMVTSDGTTRHVEFLTQCTLETDAVGADWLLDNAIRPSAQQTVTEEGRHGVRLYGLHHLEGKTVAVFAEGLDLGQTFLVTNGQTFVPFASQLFAYRQDDPWEFLVGFQYVSQGQRLRPFTSQDTGQVPTGFAKLRRSDGYGIQTVRTASGIKIGTDFTKTRPVTFKSKGGRLYTPLELYEGLHYDSLTDDYSMDSLLAWEVAGSLPATVVAIGAFLQTQDR